MARQESVSERPNYASKKSCAVKGVGFQRVQIPPGNWSLQPVAIGAAVEVTKPSKPSMERIASGDSASKQAVTKVNAEQASKQQIVDADPAIFRGRPPRWEAGER
jgi:hypothetical protein